MNHFEIEQKYLETHFSLNCHGRLVDLSGPLVMGIVNVTPDSFYSGSRTPSKEDVLSRVDRILEEGGEIIDIGACSTRPGADDLSDEEEGRRLWPVLEMIRAKHPDVLISLDTYRSFIARQAVEEYGVDFINDISGGDIDPAMFETIADLKVPYILMHIQGTPGNMQNNPRYNDVTGEVIHKLAQKVDQLRSLGVSDVIIDPGFGFGKTIAHNFQLLHELEQFKMFERPLLVGVSRKSMIYKYKGGGPEDALNGTTVLNTLALTKGANILRVHDVKEAVECVKLVTKTGL
ncbi:MAG: dihydropteroate synthase [Bacteroidota bacterium]